MNPLTKNWCNNTIPKRFEEIVSSYPNNVALIGNNQSWTYQELNKRVNQVALAILANTENANNCVAFLTDYEPVMVIATLAIVKAGKIYLAIHPKMPTSAAAKIVQDAQPEIVLTTARLKDSALEITQGYCPILVLDEIDSDSPNYNPQVSLNPNDLSTIFYTSGTTGQPKGVVKSHRTVLHRIWLCRQQDKICPTDKQSLLTYCSFASSEADIFGALLNGAALCLFDILSENLTTFRRWLEDEQITILHPPVLLFRRFLAHLEGENLFPSVRLVTLAGENVIPSDLQKWQQHFSKSCILRQRFSTTETGVLTVGEIQHNTTITNDFVLSGFPVADKSLSLVDEEGREVPQGQAGELIVKSAYIAQGYWRKPEETIAAFKLDLTDSNQRIYHTGDLGEFQADGSFKYIGRKDHQVKIRGYRVDLREVESVLAQFPEVAEAAVVARQENDEYKLLAFLVLKPEFIFNAIDIRQRLLKIIPDWKIPNQFYSLTQLPITTNGKINRQKLSEADFKIQLESEYIAPRNQTEIKLAEIWQEVLKIDTIGINDNFFVLGGNSLSATQVMSRLEQFYCVNLAVKYLFEYPTIEQLGEMLGIIIQDQLSSEIDIEFEEGQI